MFRTENRCRVCQSEDLCYFCEKNRFIVLRCDSCGLVFVDHNMTHKETLDYYSSAYDYHYPFVYSDIARAAMDRYTLLLEVSSKKAGSLLDVGCSFGYFLNVAKLSGWSVKGVEVGHDCVVYARQKFGLDIYEGTLEQAHFDSSTLDVVTLFHVLEHMANPQIALLEIKRILKPDGILLLLTPNADSLHLKLLKSIHPWLDPPKHLFCFSPRTLGLLLSKSGFNIQSMKTRKGDADNLFIQFLVGVGKCFFPSERERTSISSNMGNTFNALRKVTDIMLRPETILSSLNNLGEEIAAVARKQ